MMLLLLLLLLLLALTAALRSGYLVDFGQRSTPFSS
jgi:hypothetical protein